jgi:hypothetical protein
MRLRDLALICVACHREASTPASVGSAAAPPAITADARAHVELLHSIPTTVRVSSQVQNTAILPGHLVDGDLGTAWNSRTGDLVGAWIDIALPPGATVDELRVTAGHTGRGPHGEDYFTMNPRIRAVSVLAGDRVLGAFPLDIARRDLQPIRVQGSGTLRIRVDAIEPGSKRAWRETCVSELEAWGSLPPGVQPTPTTPTVEVEPPPPPPSEFSKLCDGFDKRLAEWEEARKHDTSTNAPGAPGCDTAPIVLAGRAEPWREAVMHCEFDDAHYGEKTCDLLARAGNEVVEIASAKMIPVHADPEVVEAAVRDVLPAAGAELVVRYRTSGSSFELEQLVVCRASPTPACAKPIALSGEDWAAHARFAKGEVVLEAAGGKPPSDALGKRALEFP